jgi:nicotinamidase-related amidase
MCLTPLLAEMDINPGGLATGGGIAALAVVLLPALNKVLEWLDKRRERAIQWEKDKRAEDAAAKLESANLFREMITAIVKNSSQLKDMEEVLRELKEHVQKFGWGKWIPPEIPKSG